MSGVEREKEWVRGLTAEKRGRRSGAPGEIRTPDLTLRRRSLYPAELRARFTRIPQLESSWDGVSGAVCSLDMNKPSGAEAHDLLNGCGTSKLVP